MKGSPIHCPDMYSQNFDKLFSFINALYLVVILSNVKEIFVFQIDGASFDLGSKYFSAIRVYCKVLGLKIQNGCIKRDFEKMKNLKFDSPWKRIALHLKQI